MRNDPRIGEEYRQQVAQRVAEALQPFVGRGDGLDSEAVRKELSQTAESLLLEYIGSTGRTLPHITVDVASGAVPYCIDLTFCVPVWVALFLYERGLGALFGIGPMRYRDLLQGQPDEGLPETIRLYVTVDIREVSNG